MNKQIGVVILTVVLLLLAGCGPSVADTKTQFCNDWQAFGTAIQNGKNLNENSTVDEAKAAKDEIVKAWEKARSSGEKLKTERKLLLAVPIPHGSVASSTFSSGRKKPCAEGR